MLYVSIFIEALRSRPGLVVFCAASAQAALWTLVPTFFYPGAPGGVPELLAVGHEFQLGTYLGPPLAFWLAEVAYQLAGDRLFGVYLLSQLCVVITYWSVFALGRDMIGRQHAAMAVLLMVGITVFTVTTPDFSPTLLATAIWALVLLHYWRAVGEDRRGYWFALALEGGLLLLTTYVGLILIGVVILFTLMSERGRATLSSIDPWIACVVIVIVLFPHLIWLEGSSDLLRPTLLRLTSAEALDDNLLAWLRMLARLAVAHAGLGVLVVLAAVRLGAKEEKVPAIVRQPIDPLARRFVYFFALMPALMTTLVAVIAGRKDPVGGTAPLLVLSGLAVIVAAGDVIHLHRQRIVGLTWAGILLLPPVIVVAAIAILPWTGSVDLKVNQPVRAMGKFFADSFQRRTGKPLAIVTGDPRLAAEVALAARSRPSVYYDAAPQRSPWVSAEDIKRKGAVVLWPTTATAGPPPPDIKQRFPDLVPEVPRAFARPVQGLLPLKRVGWGVIRPGISNQ
jgi:uncharacterized membrane protein YwzB